MLTANTVMQVYALRPANPTRCLRPAVPGSGHSGDVNAPLAHLRAVQTPVLPVCHSVLNPRNDTAYVLSLSSTQLRERDTNILFSFYLQKETPHKH